MGALKVYWASNSPVVTGDVIEALGMAPHNRQAGSVLVVAESKAEAARMLETARVSYSRREFGPVDGDVPAVEALRRAGLLDARKVLAHSPLETCRVVRIHSSERPADHIGWLARLGDDQLFVPIEMASPEQVDELARIIGAPGRTAEALRVLAAGYRKADV
jgi:hypothetical protein